MKKVLQISKYYYPFIGGVEQVVRDMAQALKLCNVEQKIICFNENASDGKVKCHKNETVHDIVDDIEVIRCGYNVKISSQSISISYIKELRLLMENFKPDIVILHYPNPYVSQLLMKYKHNSFKLLIYWHLDITRQKILKKIFHKQNIDLIKRADLIIGATPKHINESEYSMYFKDKKKILPYMINEENLFMSDEERNHAAEIKKKYADKVIGLFIGRHVEYKGLKYLIEASSKMKYDNSVFLIAGEGNLTNELKEQAKGDEKIIFLGRINDTERRAYLYACDIICFPSITRNEAFGLALAEGMYYGKPAVTFTITGSGVNYVNLKGITGIECRNRDIYEYAKALDRLCSDKKLREQYGEAARKRIKEEFTMDKFQSNVKKMMENI